jgi:hypothetical protein
MCNFSGSAFDDNRDAASGLPDLMASPVVTIQEYEA